MLTFTKAGSGLQGLMGFRKRILGVIHVQGVATYKGHPGASANINDAPRIL